MPRKARVLSPTNIYHVVIRGADHQVIFEQRADFLKYLDFLTYYKEQCKFELFAYCLMNNHIHLLLRVNEMPLASIFRRINTNYALWYNMKYNRSGYLQQGRYYSEPIADQRQLLTAICYIHHNPMRAGLEMSCGSAYEWSSFFAYRKAEPGLIDTSFVLEVSGGSEAFFDFHNSYSARVLGGTTTEDDSRFLDIDKIQKRLPDDVAKEIISAISKCSTVAEFQNLPLIERNNFILAIHKKGVSIRQLNRLTGTSRGVIMRVLKNKL